jgi:hypothetical protein
VKIQMLKERNYADSRIFKREGHEGREGERKA